MPDNIRMGTKFHTFAKTLPVTSAQKVIVIVNKNDPWSRDITPETIAKNKKYIFLNLPGTHDDIWMHPARYADVLQCIYGQ